MVIGIGVKIQSWRYRLAKLTTETCHRQSVFKSLRVPHPIVLVISLHFDKFQRTVEYRYSLSLRIRFRFYNKLDCMESATFLEQNRQLLSNSRQNVVHCQDFESGESMQPRYQSSSCLLISSIISGEVEYFGTARSPHEPRDTPPSRTRFRCPKHHMKVCGCV